MSITGWRNEHSETGGEREAADQGAARQPAGKQIPRTARAVGEGLSRSPIHGHDVYLFREPGDGSATTVLSANRVVKALLNGGD
jgi:hypothetical protein